MKKSMIGISLGGTITFTLFVLMAFLVRNNNLGLIVPQPPITVSVYQALSYQPPSVTPNIKASSINKLPTIKVVSLPKAQFPAVSVSALSLKPTFKVMPNLTKKTTPLVKNGYVQLRYSINALGKTENIKIIKSSVTKDIQRAAKKALRQWRYQPKQQFKGHYEVVFEFKAPTEKH